MKTVHRYIPMSILSLILENTYSYGQRNTNTETEINMEDQAADRS